MNSLLFASLWLHLAASSLLSGASFLLLIAGRPVDQQTVDWERQLVRICRWLAVVALLAGLIWFAARVSIFTGRVEAAIEPASILDAALQTWPGQVWAIRHVFLAVVAAYLFLTGEPDGKADWIASRSFVFLLSTVALTLFSLSGHSAAIANAPLANAADIVHLLGGGLWIGALPSLAFLLYRANKGRQQIHPYALRAVSRFSRFALVIILTITASGLVTATYLVGGVAGLTGTTHGRLLLAKVAVLVPALLLAGRVRDMLAAPLPEATSGPRGLVRRMTAYIAAEAGLVLVLLGLTAAMILSVPGRHAEPRWPFPLRYAVDEGVSNAWLFMSPSQQAVTLAATGLAVFVIAVLLWPRKRAFRAVLLASAPVLLVTAASLGTLAEAYPTSFARSPLPFDVRTIAIGRDLYERYCGDCSTQELPQSVASMTRGELFWLTKHGAREKGIPALGPDVDETARWSVVNFMEAHGTASGTRAVGSGVEPGNAWLRAPDFDVVLGPLHLGTLRDYRRDRATLLVLYSLPESQERMDALARLHARLSVLGVEIVAVPQEASANPVADLTSSPVLFPIVTEGTDDIVAAYRLLAPGAPHVEMLIDRRGYIRAIWKEAEWETTADVVEMGARMLLDEKLPDDFNDHLH